MIFMASLWKVGNQHAVQVVDLVENHDGLLALVDAAVRQTNPRPAVHGGGDARQAQAALGGADRAGNGHDARVDKDLAPRRHEQPGVDADLRSGQAQAVLFTHEEEHLADLVGRDR